MQLHSMSLKIFPATSPLSCLQLGHLITALTPDVYSFCSLFSVCFCFFLTFVTETYTVKGVLILLFLFFFAMQIDLKKMPLGKLSKKQIERAYSILNEAQKVNFEFY